MWEKVRLSITYVEPTFRSFYCPQQRKEGVLKTPLQLSSSRGQWQVPFRWLGSPAPSHAVRKRSSNCCCFRKHMTTSYGIKSLRAAILLLRSSTSRQFSFYTSLLFHNFFFLDFYLIALIQSRRPPLLRLRWPRAVWSSSLAVHRQGAKSALILLIRAEYPRSEQRISLTPFRPLPTETYHSRQAFSYHPARPSRPSTNARAVFSPFKSHR